MLVTTLAFLALAVPQDGAAVVSTGDVLTGGLTVSSLLNHSVSDTGSWVATVRTVDSASVSSKLLLQDGVIVMREEDVLLTGERVRFIVSADISSTGTVASILRVYDASGTTGSISKLALDGRTVLSEDDPLTGVGLPAGTIIQQIKDVRHRGNITLVDGTIRDNATGERDALLRFHDIASHAQTVDILAEEGAAGGGLTAPFTTLRSRMAFADDGTAAAPVRIGNFSVGSEAIISDSGALMEEGQPGPFAGSTWSSLQGPTVAVASGGRYAFCARVLESGGTTTDVIMRDGLVWAQQGQPHPAFPGNSIVNLTEMPLERASTGELFHTAFVAGIGWILAVDDEVLLRTNQSSASGVLITSLAGATNSLAISEAGQYAMIQAVLANGSLALVLVERGIGSTTSCSVTANSTGAPSNIRGVGSAVRADNQLSIEVTGLPANSFGYLNTSSTAGFTANPAGSAGNLCLGGAIGRYVDQIQQSDGAGLITTDLDLASIPQPTGPVSASAGETWYFQLWHRDSSSGGAPTSNFSASLSVTLQ